MAKMKRKGKTFVTEHYIDEKYHEEVKTLVSAWISKKFDEYELRNKPTTVLERTLATATEISLWADPRGVYIAWGNSSLLSTPAMSWNKLGVERELIIHVLVMLYEVFEKYGDQCGGTTKFKVVLNEKLYSDISLMFSL